MTLIPTVYVVQETDHSLIKAQVYGNTRIMLPRGRPLRAGADALTVREALEGVEPDDWLLPVGDPAAIAVAATEFARLTGRLRILRWDRQADDYVPLEFVL